MYRTVVTVCTAQWSLYVPHSGHCMYRTVVTICTVQWSLYVPYSGHNMYHQFNIKQLYNLPTQCIDVFCVDLRTNSDSPYSASVKVQNMFKVEDNITCSMKCKYRAAATVCTVGTWFV
jgi:hypothetical protein